MRRENRGVVQEKEKQCQRLWEDQEGSLRGLVSCAESDFLWVLNIVALDKHSHHYSSTWSIFTVLKILCGPLIRPLSGPWETLIYLLFP